MIRRDFLCLFLGSPAAVFAQDGLLIDRPETPRGFLLDHEEANGMLLDIPAEVIETQKKITVHLYSPKTWTCLPCALAIKDLQDHPGIKLVVHKDDERPEYFKDKQWPILHWGPGNAWVEGWPGKTKFLAKLFDDKSEPPVLKPVAIKDSHGSHWSVMGDWTPSREKTLNHLVSTHGFQRNRIDKLNLGQLLTLHDLVHTGRVNKNTVSRSVSKACPV